MCLLTYLPPKAPANINRLADGCEANPDGFGWAIVTASDGLLVGKGLEYESVLLEFAALRREYPEGPALFHSRIGTAGLNDIENCHPFYVNNDQRTVLAHNGILPRSVQPWGGDVRSDTRIAAESWIPRHMGNIVRKPGVRRSVERWMGKNNKIVVLTVDPKSPYSAYILNEEQGLWEDDGCWYSNMSYLTGRYRWVVSSVIGSGQKAIGTEPSVQRSCVVCTASGWDGDPDYCPWCGTCQDCLAHERDCMCYTPITTAKDLDIPAMSDADFRQMLSEIEA